MRTENGKVVGCLLLAESGNGLLSLQQLLVARGVATAAPTREDDLIAAARKALYEVRRGGGPACIAAQGEMWGAALSLAAQVQVDRVALIAPEDLSRRGDAEGKQIERLKGYARRNLFFCVSDVLVLESESDAVSTRRIDAVCRRLTNARVWRTQPVSREMLYGARWMQTIAHFLTNEGYNNFACEIP